MGSDLAMWCFAEPGQWTESQIELSDEEIRHAHQVMRLDEGACLHVFDGKGRVGTGPLKLTSKRSGHVELHSSFIQDRPTLHSVTLAAALCKSTRWEWMLEKAGELGVGAVIPIQSRRATVKASVRAEAKLRKWRTLFIRACKQSHNAWLPDISPFQTLEEWLESSPPQIVLTGALTEDARTLEAVLPTLNFKQTACGVVLGPEGDFDEEEYQRLREAGAYMLDFGPRILRCETAALYVLSSLMYEIQRQHHE